jgi:hypothetical protein
MRVHIGKQAVRRAESGSALIPALMVVSLLAMLGLSMLSAGLSGSRAADGQSEEYRLTSAVESVATLSADTIWSGYLRAQGGAPGTVDTFRAYMTSINLPDSGTAGVPAAGAGTDMLPTLGIAGGGHPEFDKVAVDSVHVVRADAGDATRLFVSVQATTKRGEGLATPALNRSVQIAYTVEPAPFEGFEYGILTKNVNCVFCHTVVDSADRYYNHDPSLVGTFDRVKVGTLESLMLRSDSDPRIGDWDADSLLAGSLYVRGQATNHNGAPISSWGNLAFHSAAFGEDGHLLANGMNGALTPTTFSPAGDVAMGNLYLDYPTEYAQMPDGGLPTSFPPPFPDDGGVDPATGVATTTGAGNHLVDPNEFYAATQNAHGTISGGVLTVVTGSQSIITPQQTTTAFGTGNTTSLGGVTHGSVVMTGTAENPILINGTVAIDGDVIVDGYVKGTGVILAKGNVYVPTDLHYLDGHSYVEGDEPGNPTGPITFGVAQDGTENALGLACGGSMMLGDYLAPSAGAGAGSNAVVTGGPDGQFNFSLAEITLFNRTEWAHTQEFLPGEGEDNSDPSTWHAHNPGYIPGYVPRYYQFGPGDQIPIYNMGDLYFDPVSGTWRGDAEVPIAWDPAKLTLLDPADTSNPLLYDPATGAPLATVHDLAPHDGWISEQMLEAAIENLGAHHPNGTPMQIDGLLYTNNALFGVVPRSGPMGGQMIVNGSLVCADLGLLAPGHYAGAGSVGSPGNVPGSPFAVGLRLNYDKRTRSMLNVRNPNSVTIRRTLWNPL